MRVRVRVPASSANLGPGFDALALALALHNEVMLEESDRLSLTVSGEGEGRLHAGADNVVARGVLLAYAAAGRPFQGAAIHCVNRIPFGRGLGSSAAAWVAGLVGGNALLGDPLDRDALVTLAARAEGHPDNVAAAILGGLTISCASDDRIVALALPVPPDLHWVVLVPKLEGSTHEARAVLPAAVSRGDAVFNVQRVSMLLAALFTDRRELLELAMQDRLHQPYRFPLFPWMAEVSAAARRAGALGCVLSGAGSALLAAVRGPAAPVERAMEGALRAAGIDGTAASLAVDTAGATWESLG
ncbi:MAG TPA: homoserine kinase [Methylomirabilota bacterium]|jgi:homoserine kinase|nr:homoserine kinase [Methylomirabilota bacterium]